MDHMNDMTGEQITTTTKSPTVQSQKHEDATQQANGARRRPVPVHCECGD